MRCTYGILAVLLLAAGCDETTTEPEPSDPTRSLEQGWIYRDWIVPAVPRADLRDIEIQSNVQEGPGVVSVLHEAGELG